MNLHTTTVGAGPAILLLHGFTGSAEEWAELTPALAPHRQVIAVDLPGHGRSTAQCLTPSMPQCSAGLLALMDDLGHAQFDLLGYSMGGRAALHLAAAAPQRVRSLILESASPGLADPAERAARAAADDALAERILAQGLGWFVDYWQGIPLFASQASLPAEARAALRARRLRNSPQGLACSLRGMGTGRQASLWHRLGELAMPTLLITGALDAKFVAINRQMAALMPSARHISLPAAGHAAHLERPQEFADLVVGYLSS
ncbi:2-succinyl-6-hydroxy-2,4-cyclohexadiene-1-carboxylate synthase [Oscillochloris sp. ZM17-4]|uniref:2-succinyl-6-hydroxy-2, 4-cyclohexadiene-1-carboxylate synthase n=1 Tax=Oscillochloris sp. ZM17-4 TaxID=2866714 RepID=UPI001C731148|nr:2-succinyl-6-hydroxy-2,4-cyclohexadiene-1-carboxylate synthase [Oscillochloris sp. ZM17-4]MBX0328271.1 2-succinyl-6-hydroxy-2,4-cyclohexadiene-1-carboxylate synthase [Oscillochloris sp. ZM17-4]